MSREHKYRGKRLDNGKWVYGSFLGGRLCHIMSHKTVKKTDSTSMFAGYEVLPVLPETVGEYTGLKDKYGKKIYKGDIIRYISKYLEHPVDFEVVYYNGCYAQRHLDTKMEDMPEEATDAIYRYWNQLKVIGDIHENPELLKK